jgi:hypothetical protein
LSRSLMTSKPRFLGDGKIRKMYLPTTRVQLITEKRPIVLSFGISFEALVETWGDAPAYGE